ncbi:MAG: translation elongation factor Ts [Candidatus Hydrothermae bacterium]|uniref:Elongation factor Ts n=1 Tax=candidate division WOR-3 bacterium TaxID=2052148 RepID=A0A7C0X9Z6_UNCW3|nr:translation elongation factor Ts [Candidatus Hydrothermae bacterium]HDM90696.1 translation elongation factor Ts [candidate division WOR-3 bacterium]
MAVDMELVKQLRKMTGAGVLDCKKALEKTGGDLDKAVEELRKMGIAKAEKKMSREAREGIIDAYIHPGAKLGVLVEVNCETDFVANTAEFKDLVHNIALQIAATGPLAVSREQIPEEIIEKEKEIYRAQLEGSNKPPHIIEKIVEGKLEKFFQEAALLEQPFIKDPQKTVGDLVKEYIAKFGENIVIRRFARFRLGEE